MCTQLSISDEVWASVHSLSNMFTTAIFLSQMKLYLDVDQSEGLKGWLIKRIKHKWNVFQVSQSFALFAEQNEAHIINKNFANSERFSLGDLESTHSLPFLPLFFVRESMCVRLTFAGVFVYGVLSLSLWPHPWNSGCSIFPEHGSGILWPDSTNSKTTSHFFIQNCSVLKHMRSFIISMLNIWRSAFISASKGKTQIYKTFCRKKRSET